MQMLPPPSPLLAPPAQCASSACASAVAAHRRGVPPHRRPQWAPALQFATRDVALVLQQEPVGHLPRELGRGGRGQHGPSRLRRIGGDVAGAGHHPVEGVCSGEGAPRWVCQPLWCGGMWSVAEGRTGCGCGGGGGGGGAACFYNGVVNSPLERQIRWLLPGGGRRAAASLPLPLSVSSCPILCDRKVPVVL